MGQQHPQPTPARPERTAAAQTERADSGGLAIAVFNRAGSELKQRVRIVLTSPSSPARFLSSYEWISDRETFGGYSGISLSADGSDFTLLSDRGHTIVGSLFRHNDQIIGVRSHSPQPLQIPDELFAKTPKLDAEGLAALASGEFFVSLEHENRIARRAPDNTWSLLPAHPKINGLARNKGLEALAVSPDGALFTIPESSPGWNKPFPVYRYTASAGWDTAFQITRALGFLPVGADFDDQGALYVLERGFSGFGFFSQIRKFNTTRNAALNGELVMQSHVVQHDNLEGLSVWRAPDGVLRLTMVSDDNFNRLQKTEIVEYALG